MYLPHKSWACSVNLCSVCAGTPISMYWVGRGQGSGKVLNFHGKVWECLGLPNRTHMQTKKGMWDRFPTTPCAISREMIGMENAFLSDSQWLTRHSIPCSTTTRWMGMASSFALICLALNDLSTCSYEGSPDFAWFNEKQRWNEKSALAAAADQPRWQNSGRNSQVWTSDDY